MKKFHNFFVQSSQYPLSFCSSPINFLTTRRWRVAGWQQGWEMQHQSQVRGILTLSQPSLLGLESDDSFRHMLTAKCLLNSIVKWFHRDNNGKSLLILSSKLQCKWYSDCVQGLNLLEALAWLAVIIIISSSPFSRRGGDNKMAGISITVRTQETAKRGSGRPHLILHPVHLPRCSIHWYLERMKEKENYNTIQLSCMADKHLLSRYWSLRFLIWVPERRERLWCNFM